MTAYEFEQCRQLADKWWPGINWTLDPDVFRLFKHVTVEAARTAIERLAEEPRDRYPSLAAFLRTAKAVQADKPTAADPATCEHVWALLPEAEQVIERKRRHKAENLCLAVCRCGLERWGEWKLASQVTDV